MPIPHHNSHIVIFFFRNTLTQNVIGRTTERGLRLTLAADGGTFDSAAGPGRGSDPGRHSASAQNDSRAKPPLKRKGTWVREDPGAGNVTKVRLWGAQKTPTGGEGVPDAQSRCE